MPLNREHLLLRERVLGHLDEVRDDGRVELVELARDKHRCNTKKLKLHDLDVLARQESIDQIYCALNRFWYQFKFDLDYHQPINQNLAVFVGQFVLLCKQILVGLRKGLAFEKLIMDGQDVVFLS